MMDELLKKLAAKGQSQASPEEVQAKLEVVQELLSMAQNAMADGVHGGMMGMMPKPEASVEVAADDTEGLAEGLDMAKGLVESEDVDSLSDVPEMEEDPEMEAAEMETDDEDEDDEDGKPKRAFPSLL